MDCTVHGILQARILENWVAIPFSRGSSQPRDRTQVSCIAGGFFTIVAPGKPKNTGVGSLSLLQWIFLTQESNLGLLHCRWTLYQLRYKHILISWLQSQSDVILEPKKRNSVTVSIVSPSMYPEVMGLYAMIFVFQMLSFKPAFSLSSFTLIKRLFSSSWLSAIRVVLQLNT